jgi:hypothetical protein
MTDLAPTARLSLAEADLLAECEDVIAQGLQTFFDVGNALISIRENKLYRKSHATFDAYCVEKWGISDSRARQLISAAWTVTNVTVAGLPAPENEGQARALGRVAKEDLADVWAETLERTDGRPTAAAVEAVAAERRADPELVDTPIGPVTRPVAAALDRHAPDPDPHADWRARFLKRVHAVHAVMRSKPEDVAEKADDLCLQELSSCAEELADYRRAVARAVTANAPDNVTPIRRSS